MDRLPITSETDVISDIRTSECDVIDDVTISKCDVIDDVTIDRIQLYSVGFMMPTAAMFVLNLTIIVGNVMVITAVFTHVKLRSSTTNKFIVSLAVADLMVGVVVLPFSSTNQVSYTTFSSTNHVSYTTFSSTNQVICNVFL